MKKKDKSWYLYILKYKKTGNFYVGATDNLKSRMNKHRLRTSKKNLHAKQSILNKSVEGFYYFWYKIEGIEPTQSNSNMVENILEKYVGNWVEKGVIVRGGTNNSFTDDEENQIETIIRKDELFTLSENEKNFFEKEVPEYFSCMIAEKKIHLKLHSVIE